jgi:hypothetical protein
MEKIDVIKNKVFCYDENCDLIKSLNLADFQNIDFSYLEGSKLFSFNLIEPVKRIVKFTEVNGLDSNAEFEVYLYEEMTKEQQADFNSFVTQAEIL